MEPCGLAGPPRRGGQRWAGLGAPRVAGYNPDALAAARGPVPLAEGVELERATRGSPRAEDIARNNCHDAYHHL
ncbi:hypothetical protein [Paractinoplanes rishiriensis]|uniref:Uncharacterized protein n=1 Tax=Paractinoplanes rishiriensis TaxID=1050105 RepID=A0A919K2T2_9ACTN|nr:hypothetical protein [Actinoplanes rishiriensis]GIE95591.1 hypothetical protein Ari01nite_30560 [Actinoplanes rishiriensis]